MEKYDVKGGVICQVCGLSFKQITPQHLKKFHNISQDEYKAQFPGFPIISLTFDAIKRYGSIRKVENAVKDEVDIIKEEVRIEEFKLDRVPKIDEKLKEESNNFVDDIKDFIEKTKEVVKNKYPDPSNKIHKNKIKLLNYLISIFPDVKNSYYIEKYTISNFLEYRLITDISIPSLKIDIEFPKTFWHNLDILKQQRDEKLKKDGWKIIDINDPNPSIDSLEKVLKNFNLI